MIFAIQDTNTKSSRYAYLISFRPRQVETPRVRVHRIRHEPRSRQGHGQQLEARGPSTSTFNSTTAICIRDARSVPKGMNQGMNI